jgi:hypothetical protein
MAGRYPTSILKVFYLHKNGWSIPHKHLKGLLLAEKRLVDTHQAF